MGNKRPNKKDLNAVIGKTNQIIGMILNLQSFRFSFNTQKQYYNADYNDSNSLQTICSLYDSIYTKGYFRDARKFLEVLNNLSQDLEIVSSLQNPIKWIFTGNVKKTEFFNAYDNLLKMSYSYDELIQLYSNIESVVSKNSQDKKLIFLSNQRLFFDTFITHFQIRPYFFPTETLQPLLVEGSSYFDTSKLYQFYSDFERLQERKQFIDQNYFSAFGTVLRNDYENCKMDEVNCKLQKTDISVLSFDVSSRTLQKLKDNNITTVDAALARDLTFIQGIGVNTEEIIKTAARQYRQDILRKTQKITINIDKRTSNDTKILRHIYIYKAYDEDFKLLQRMCNEARYIDASTYYQFLNKNIVGFNWFFAEDYNKQQFIELLWLITGCYNKLNIKINDLYSKLIRLLGMNLTNDGQHRYLQEIWSDFENTSSTYYAIIEEVLGLHYEDEKSDELLGRDLVSDIKDTKVYVSSNLHLRPYQFFGTQFILNQGKVIIGDEMGLGKTIEAIAALTTLNHNGFKKFLIVCPASIMANWEDEIKRFSDLQVILIRSNTDFDQWKNDNKVGIVSYNMVSKFGFSGLSIDCLIVDEAHYIKNETLRRFGVSQCIRISKNVILITGTPMENRVKEMTGLIGLIKPTLSNTLSLFEQNHYEFKKKIAPVYLRRKREDVLSELPDLIENIEWCEMTTEENSLYSKVLSENNNALAIFTKVRKELWEAHASSKANRLWELIDMAAAENRKVLVFSEYLNVLSRAKKIAAEKYIGTISGDIPYAKRTDLIQKFNNHKGSCVMCMQIQAGGIGINLQSASVVIICEPQWKPTTEQQAIARAYRMGQTRNVLVYYLVADNQIEKYIISQSAEKVNLFKDYADRGESTKGMSKQAYMNYLLAMERKNRGIEVIS